MKKSELKKLIRETIEEIALNRNEYEISVEFAAQKILDYAQKNKKLPDINAVLEVLANEFNKNIDDVHTDVARAFHKMRK